ARSRDAGIYLDYGYTRPSVISEGGIRQNPEGEPPLLDGGGHMMPEGAMFDGSSEELPVPGGMYETGRGSRPVKSASTGKRFDWGSMGLADSQGEAASGTKLSQEAPDDVYLRLVGGDASAKGASAKGAIASKPTSTMKIKVEAAQGEPASS